MTRRKAPMIAVLVVLVLVAALLGGELYVRQQIKSCLAGQLENELGSEVEVGLGWKPILISLVDKQVSSVTLDSNDARFGPAVDMTVSAEVEDVDLEQSAESGGTIGSSNADIAWSTAGIAATLQSQGSRGLVSDVTSDAAVSTRHDTDIPHGHRQRNRAATRRRRVRDSAATSRSDGGGTRGLRSARLSEI